jgi:hypothetical protein
MGKPHAVISQLCGAKYGADYRVATDDSSNLLSICSSQVFIGADPFFYFEGEKYEQK